jgi:hypothetical protein
MVLEEQVLLEQVVVEDLVELQDPQTLLLEEETMVEVVEVDLIIPVLVLLVLLVQ